MSIFRLHAVSAIRLTMTGYDGYGFSVTNLSSGIDKSKKNCDLCRTRNKKKKNAL